MGTKRDIRSGFWIVRDCRTLYNNVGRLVQGNTKLTLTFDEITESPFLKNTR